MIYYMFIGVFAWFLFGLEGLRLSCKYGLNRFWDKIEFYQIVMYMFGGFIWWLLEAICCLGKILEHNFKFDGSFKNPYYKEK